MWAALSAQGVIGPFFFEDIQGNTVSVNSERYINILKKFKDLLRRRVNIMEAQWLCQDGASPHVSHLSLQWLRDNFGDHVISLKTGFVWAPYYVFPRSEPFGFFSLGTSKRHSVQRCPTNN